MTDVAASWFGHLPPELLELLNQHGEVAFDAAMTEATQQSPALRAHLAFRMRLHGLTDRIRCPLLITDPAQEQYFPGQPQQLYRALTGPKALVPFTAEDGSHLYCEVQALAPLRGEGVIATKFGLALGPATGATTG